MPDAMMYAGAASAAAAGVAPSVLVVGGRAAASRLLDLARWAGAREESLHLLVPGEYAAHRATEALDRLLASPEQGASPLLTVRLLDAIASTGAQSVVLGYPADADGRADFALAVQRLRAEADVDVIVYFERHRRPWQRVLVPYLSMKIDNAALQLASQSGLDVTLLHAVEPFGEPDTTIIRRAERDASGCTLRVVETHDPLTAAAEEARRGYDLVVIGGGQRARHPRPFTMRQQRLLLSTDVSLVMVHSAH